MVWRVDVESVVMMYGLKDCFWFTVDNIIVWRVDVGSLVITHNLDVGSRW